ILRYAINLVCSMGADGGQSEPFIVTIIPDDPDILETIPPGAAGLAAMYTDSAAATHVIRKVIVRMNSILNYIRPGL
ncbi:MULTISPECIES: hypothetical protein, partial [unclassified Ruegeria]|uniref:hypothetical protein n=1 Tax=unclassified Ruegeria TaxID=2625375 RepID=UPI001C122CDF